MPNIDIKRPDDIITEFGVDDLHHPAFMAVYQYWLDVRENNPYPDVKKLDPLALPRKALPFIIICGVEGDPPEFPLRLTGSKIVEETGVDNTNKTITEIPGSEGIQKRLTWAALTGQKYFARKQITWTDISYKQYDVLVLPFGDANMVTKLLVMMDVFVSSSK